ncbi:methyltransferase domain-containing protein [Streptomyces sp. NPDC015032]|uniref:methyltransferase domain-containing protein n=1 Tax=Streptomyces sp. NPDC015032 TaxID=3364937 RepID=UPI0036F9AF68
MPDELRLRRGHTVLDLGCGPGTDLGVLAEAVTATGQVIGVDHDRASVEIARQRIPDAQPVAGPSHRRPLPRGGDALHRGGRIVNRSRRPEPPHCGRPSA